MPSEYYYDPNEETLVTRMWGIIGGSDVLKHVKAVVSDPNVIPASRELVDLRDVRLSDAHTGIGASLAPARRRHARAKIRTAIVVALKSEQEAARMYESIAQRLSGSGRVEIFQSVKKAKEWLAAGKSGRRQAPPSAHGSNPPGHEPRSRHH